MQTLVLQPQNWSVLGGSQPAWLWRPSASPAAVCSHTPLLTTQPEMNPGQKEQLQSGRKEAKEAAGHFRTGVPLGCPLLYPLNTWGLPSLGMCLLQSSSISCSRIVPEKQFLDHLTKTNFFFLITLIFHCAFYCLLATILKFNSSA